MSTRHALAAVLAALGFVAPASAEETPRELGVTGGISAGVYGPGFKLGVDLGARYRAFEVGVFGDGATALFGPSVGSFGAYAGGGWDLDSSFTLHAAAVGGRHSWTNAGSSGLFDPGINGETAFAGGRLIGEYRTRSTWAPGIGLVLTVTDDLTRQSRQIPADEGFFGHPARTKTLGELDAGVALRLSFDFGI